MLCTHQRSVWWRNKQIIIKNNNPISTIDFTDCHLIFKETKNQFHSVLLFLVMKHSNKSFWITLYIIMVGSSKPEFCFRCTSLYGTPTMFIDILDSPKFSDYNVSSLHTGISFNLPLYQIATLGSVDLIVPISPCTYFSTRTQAHRPNY